MGARRPYFAEHRPTAAGITPRERAILLLCASGLAHAEIAARLCCSPETVKAHLSHLYARWEARNQTHAMALAVLNGVITGEDIAAALKVSQP